MHQNQSGMGNYKCALCSALIDPLSSVSRLWNLAATTSVSRKTPCLVASSAIDTRLLCAKGNTKRTESVPVN